MGALGLSGKDGSEHIDAPEPGAPEAPAPESEGRSRDDGGRFVPASKLQPEESAESRRNKVWQERVEAHVKPLKEEWETSRRTYETRLEEAERRDRERAEEIARMRGAIEAMQRMPQQQAQQQSGPDPEKLRAEADAALDAGNMSLWRQKDREATRAEIAQATAEVRKLVEQQQRQQPQGIPFEIQEKLIQHPHVRNAGAKGARAVVRAREDLHDEGYRGADLEARTWAKAEAELAAKAKASAAPARPQYSQDAAAALSARPTNRPAGGGGGQEDGVTLTPQQEAAWKAGGFKSREEYLKWQDPEKYNLIKRR